VALNERDKRAIRWGGPAIGLLFAAIFVFGPLLDRWDAMTAEHDSLVEQSANHFDQLTMKRRMQRSIASLEEEIGPFQEPLEYNRQITRLDKAVGEAAKKSGVALKVVRRQESEAIRGFTAYRMAGVRIQLDAPLGKLAEFLHRLEQTPGVVSVERLDLTADPKKPNQISTQMRISTFVLPQREGTS
jgi:Tfp pilus assembly protein PilO